MSSTASFLFASHIILIGNKLLHTSSLHIPYSNIHTKWKNPAVLNEILNGLLAGLRDPCIPVQNCAACSLKVLVKLDSAKQMIKPLLPGLLHKTKACFSHGASNRNHRHSIDIVKEFLRIIHSSESPESVLESLQVIVEQFGEGIFPIATGACDIYA